MRSSISVQIFAVLMLFGGFVIPNHSSAADLKQLFTPENETALVLKIEAALARAQAEAGIIPGWAAAEITAKADIRYANQKDLQAEYQIVRHRMVALINVWSRSMEQGAEEYIHFGATTVDIYDTSKVLQLLEATDLLIDQLREIEAVMIKLANTHKATPMIGRTLGQHALPITFGKKVSVWIGENRRHINRLQRVRGELQQSAIMKGAVGSYLGLGEKGVQVELVFARELGMAAPYADDWHGSRDVFGQYAAQLGLLAKSWGRIGTELFLLQSTDIGETEEYRPKSVVGSSTMPHKNNPSKSEALIHYSRRIPRLAEALTDDMMNYYERDNTSRPNQSLNEVTLETGLMLDAANKLLAELIVRPDVMMRNLNKTRGLIMTQRLVFELAPSMGKQTANDKIHDVALYAMEHQVSLRDAISKFPDISEKLPARALDELMDVTGYLGLAEEMVNRVIEETEKARESD